MKRTLFFKLSLLFLWTGVSLIKAQTVGNLSVNDVATIPIVSTTSSPTYYYILSAATQMIPNDNAGIPSTYFPMFEKNIVLTNTTQTESNYKARVAQYTHGEHFQIINENGSVKLKNRATGGYMVNSWGSSATAEVFEYSVISGTSKQYLLKNTGRSPLWIKYSNGEIIANRYNYSNGGAANESKTSAWYFVPASDVKTQIFMLRNEARQLKATLTTGVHPGQLSKSTYDEFVESLATIETSNDLTQITLDALNAAISKVKMEVIMPSAGETYFIKSASNPYDSRGYFLYTNSSGNPASSDANVANGDEFMWDLKNSGNSLVMVNKKTNNQIQAVSTSNTAFAMGTTDVPVSFTYLGDGQFNIKSGSIVYHRSNTSQKALFNWNGGINSASAWMLYKADDSYYTEGLKNLISEAEALKANTALGLNPGAAPEEAHSDLQEAITLAKAVTSAYKEAYDSLSAAISIFKTKKVSVILSDATKEQLYFITSAATNAYCKGKVIKGASRSVQMNFVTKRMDPMMIWKFIDRGNGKVAIQNKATGLYMQHPISSGCSDSPVDYSLIDLNFLGQYNIQNSSNTPLHCQESGSVVVNWAGGVDSPSSWIFEPLSESEMSQSVAIYDITARQGRTSTGIGNTDATLLSIEVLVEGIVGETTLKSLTFNLDETTSLDDIQKINLYKTTTDYRFRQSDAIKVASVDPREGNITITFENPIELSSGSNYFWLNCDVSDRANEGNVIDAKIVSCMDEKDNVITSSSGNPQYAATIFATQATVLTCGDWGSKYYRIPAIVTANNGTLVAVADRRINSNVDLPAHVDVYVNLSSDNGKTWSDPICVAGDEPGTIGYGDAAILKNKNGRIIILYNGGVKGLWDSSVANPFKKYKVHSDDNGLTWSTPVDITSQLYAVGCSDPIAASWTSMLLTSGVGICTREGVLMVAVAAAVPGKNGFSDYAAVSYDNGDTWKVESAQTAWESGDEAKFVQLNNGDIMISMRRGGSRQINTSPDNGRTWRTSYQHSQLISPACNGEILRYTSTLDGYDKNRILHSLPYASSRTNVSVMMSYDEGQTYPIRKTICPGASAYSALTILPNGNIGCYFEDGGENMDMVFVSFSLSWLTDGADTYLEPTTSIHNTPSLEFKAWFDNGIIKTSRPDLSHEIYDATGVKLQGNKALPSGIYLVKIGNTVQTIVK